jgi:prolyl 4-hydroxylase
MSDDIDALRARAQAGEPRALTALGRRLLLAEDVRPSPPDGVACLRQAARLGDGEATWWLARLAAFGVLQPRDPDLAVDLLQRAAELGWGRAQAELRLLAGADGADWSALRAQISVADFTHAPAPRRIMEKPRIRVFEAFATTGECAWLIDSARGDLRRAQIYHGSAEPQASDLRTNTEADLMLKASDVVVGLMRERVARAVGVAPEFCEVAKVLHYEPGQTFHRHADFLETKRPSLQEEVRQRGQRVATFLLYLNDDYSGGETDFPDIGYRYKGRTGDALLFLNVDEAGAPDYSTTHAGLPPAAGEKWLLSQWVRSRPINAFMTPGTMPPPLGADWLRSV